MKNSIRISRVILLILSIFLIHSCKKQPTPPVISTTTVTAISYTTATSGGEVTNEGGASVTAKGVCWNTSLNPTITNNKTTDGTGTGSFNSSLTGLTAGTTYYVRAYATNTAGTGYGNQVTFSTLQVAAPVLTTTAITSITQTTAVSGGNITTDNGSSVTARGVCWGTVTNPTTANNKTTDGAGTGSFNSSLTGLIAGTTYYVRAYATNTAGTGYGNQVTFTTSQIALATLTTTAITAITQTTAVTGGNITTDNGSSVTARGVCWGTVTNPTTANNKTTDGTGTGSFVSNLISLQPGTIYYVRSYATNSVGTSYGNEISFTTTATVPTLTTTAASSITSTTATSGGNISSDGGAAVTARGVCWSTSQNPTTANTKTTDSNGAGSFTSSLTGLTANTTYYVRAYATNSAGTSYGSAISFTTINLNTFTDSRDGHVYKFVTIGTQTWMAENLAYLPSVSPNSADSYTVPYYYVYGYQGTSVSAAKATSNYITYGVLYNSPASNTAAPSGWHTPTDAEWNVLITYLGGPAIAGTKLKSSTGWPIGGDGDNSSGFNALPSGGKLEDGNFSNMGQWAYFWVYWTPTSYDNNFAWSWTFGSTAVVTHRTMLRQAGWAVRCIKD